MEISLVMPAKDIYHFKWAYKNIQKNKGKHNVFICTIADNCDTEAVNYFTELAKQDDHFLFINNSSGKSWGCAICYNKIIRELVKTEVFMIFHTDMYLCPNSFDILEKNLKRKTIISLTRIEPPLHPEGKEKITMDFGTELSNFNEDLLLKWVAENSYKYVNQTSVGAFAPWVMFKDEFEEIGCHDEYNFVPFMFEDTDLYQRLLLNGFGMIQLRDAFVYHLTCRGWKFKNGVDGKLTLEEENLYSNINVKNARNFIRKWGRFFEHDEYLKPLITNRYDVGFILKNCDEYDIMLLEPYADTIYSDLNYNRYITNEQKNTKFNLTKKLKHITDTKTNNVIVEFDTKKLSQELFISLSNMQKVIQHTNKVGNFEYSIFKVEIKDLTDYSKELINLNNPYYLNKLID